MKLDTQTFIDEVMESIDYSFVSERDISENEQQYLLDDIEDFDGKIVISFKEASGMVTVKVFSADKKSKNTLAIMEDNLDIDQAVGNINEMIVEVMSEDEEEPVDYSEKMSFDDIYAGPQDEVEEEPVEDEVYCKVYLEPNGEAMLLLDEEADVNGSLLCYVHNGQHSSCDPYYPDELTELSARDPRAKDLISEYETMGAEPVKLVVLPEGELLSVQKKTHKDISSLD